MIDLISKLGKINNIEHNKGSKIYPQNQVILDCIMPSISLKHKWLSIILTWAWFLIVVSKKSKKKNFFFFFFFYFLDIVLGKKGCYFRLGSAPREGQKIP